MKKIISLFCRNYDGDRLIRDEIVPGAEWVVEGKGCPSEKLDGSACMVKDHVLYKRYDCKKGKTPPVDFIPAQDPDGVTRHWPGWVPVDLANPADKWYTHAVHEAKSLCDWTYEIIGPHFQGNPYKEPEDRLIRHGVVMWYSFLLPHEAKVLEYLTPEQYREYYEEPVFTAPPITFAELKEWLELRNIEGIVWWKDLNDVDCDKVKIKRKDFGFPWPITKVESTVG